MSRRPSFLSWPILLLIASIVAGATFVQSVREDIRFARAASAVMYSKTPANWIVSYQARHARQDALFEDMALSTAAALAALFAILRIEADWKLLTGSDRRDSGSCPTCSYNLTGNTSGVCPECGTVVAGFKRLPG